MNHQSPDILAPANMPDEITTGEIGGKAFQLWKIGKTGLNVPPWFVITSDAFEQWIGPVRSPLLALLAEVKDAPSARSVAEKISTLLDQCRLEEPFARQLSFHVYRQFGVCTRLAVRSSAADEDGSQHSFAGQFDSFLNVRPDDVSSAVLRVWRSAFSERVLAYRAAKNLPCDQIRIAVIVQTLVNAASSGVMFTRTPESQAPQVLIEAAFGLGEGVVSDHAVTDSYRIAWTGWLPARTIRDKHWHVASAPHSQTGTTRIELPAELATRPVLSLSQIWRLRKVAITLDKHFGAAQDIEWAFDQSGTLHILQSRAITTGNFSSGSCSGRVWDNANIVESYPGLTLPLTFSFITKNYEVLFCNAACGMLLSRSKLARRTDIWENMVGLVHGRVYYNLLNWYAMLSYLPGFKQHKKSWDQMIGIGRKLDITASHLAWYDRLYATGQVIYRLLAVRRIEKSFFKRFNPLYCRYSGTDTGAMNESELMAHYARMERELLSFWHLTLYTDFCAMKYYDWLARLCRRWAGDTTVNLHSDLLCGQPNIESVGPIRSVVAIAEQIRASALYRQLFSQHDDEMVWQTICSDLIYLPLREQIDAHLQLYGDRCAEELKLETITPRENPALLIGTLRNYIISDLTVASLQEREQRKVAEAERSLARRIPNPFKRAAVGFVLRQARAAISGRENMRFARTRAYGLVRAVVREFSRHLAARGVIERPTDIGYLSLREVFSFVNATTVLSNLRQTVSQRKAQYQQFAQEILPSRFETSGSTSSCRLEHVTEGPDCAGRLVGTGCSSGVAEGGAVVLVSANASSINHQNILVAESTDPSWVFLMAQAGGLIAERGSVLSHTAIIGRELGIPTIVGVRNATRLIANGCRVRMNGATGEVVWS